MLMKKAKGCVAGTVGAIIGGSLALCCSIPLGVVGLVVLAVVKVPRALCKRVVRMRSKVSIAEKGNEIDVSDIGEVIYVERSPAMPSPVQLEIEEMEKKMRGQFPGIGFWQSPPPG
ncbi:Pollen preferential protein [Rhynchospora pubera]|uniref:Pollen preferential protein n=1 Tax=Rhynchospora pubera TaxID=906938 RepID=A0AAV8GJW9_9POAL|nr:Pollen preferential protein [Rhynchospora pubera]